MSRNIFAHFGKKNVYLNTEILILQSQWKIFQGLNSMGFFFARTNFYCRIPQVTPEKLDWGAEGNHEVPDELGNLW